MEATLGRDKRIELAESVSCALSTPASPGGAFSSSESNHNLCFHEHPHFLIMSSYQLAALSLHWAWVTGQLIAASFVAWLAVRYGALETKGGMSWVVAVC